MTKKEPCATKAELDALRKSHEALGNALGIILLIAVIGAGIIGVFWMIASTVGNISYDNGYTKAYRCFFQQYQDDKSLTYALDHCTHN